MALEFSYTVPSCGQPDDRPAILADVHYLYFALILLAVTSLTIVAVSLATAPIPKEHVSNISFYPAATLHPHMWTLHFIPHCV